MDNRSWYVIATAGVPSSDLKHAQREAAEIYASAGIDLLWVLGHAEDHPPVGLDVRVVLLDGTRSQKWINERHLDQDVLGFGSHGGWAYVFVHRVTLHSFSAHGRFSEVLGRVMAHELGHVLLPGHSHAPKGIMRPSVDMLTGAERYFTPTQAETLLNILTPAN
jgi:hypothetical protein